MSVSETTMVTSFNRGDLARILRLPERQIVAWQRAGLMPRMSLPRGSVASRLARNSRSAGSRHSGTGRRSRRSCLECVRSRGFLMGCKNDEGPGRLRDRGLLASTAIYLRTLNSTRRFSARPALVLLLAIGFFSP